MKYVMNEMQEAKANYRMLIVVFDWLQTEVNDSSHITESEIKVR